MFIDSKLWNSRIFGTLQYITRHYQNWWWLTFGLFHSPDSYCTFLLFIYYNCKPVKCTRVNKVIIINGKRLSCLGTEWIPGKEETLLSTVLLSVKWWAVGNSFRNKRSKEVCIVVLWRYVHCDYHISSSLEMCYLITELTTNSKNVSWNYRYWDNFEIDACHNHLNEQNADSQLTKENGLDISRLFGNPQLLRTPGTNYEQQCTEIRPIPRDWLLDESSYNPTSHKATSIKTLARVARLVYDALTAESLSDENRYLEHDFTWATVMLTTHRLTKTDKTNRTDSCCYSDYTLHLH